jgi:hypothetical protein
MNVIDLSLNRVEGGFFLLNGLRNPQPFEWPLENGDSFHFVGTYQNSGAPIRDCLIKLIREATHRLFVASFMLGDENVIAELLQAAERLKGGVYVITALDDKSLRKGLSEYEESEQSKPEERQKNFRRLTMGGIYVRGHGECHAKFAVADDQVALVGSANFVTNAFEWTNEANILIRDQLQVRQAARLFTSLWYGGCKWEVPPGQAYTVNVEYGLRDQGVYALIAARGPLLLSNSQVRPLSRGLNIARIDQLHRQTRLNPPSNRVRRFPGPTNPGLK